MTQSNNGQQAVVIIEHEGGLYNLYLSDVGGVYYSLSLRDLVVERGTPDLEQVGGGGEVEWGREGGDGRRERGRWRGEGGRKGMRRWGSEGK